MSMRQSPKTTLAACEATQIRAGLGTKPGTPAIQTAAEQDRQKTAKACYALQITGPKVKPQSKHYAAGAS